MTDFCSTLKERRQRVGLSQKKLAQLAGVHFRTIANAEHGHVLKPYKYTVDSINSVLDEEERKLESGEKLCD